MHRETFSRPAILACSDKRFNPPANYRLQTLVANDTPAGDWTEPNIGAEPSTCLGISGHFLQGFFLRSCFLQHFDLAFFFFSFVFLVELQVPEHAPWQRFSAISTSDIEELNTLSICTPQNGQAIQPVCIAFPQRSHGFMPPPVFPSLGPPK